MRRLLSSLHLLLLAALLLGGFSLAAQASAPSAPAGAPLLAAPTPTAAPRLPPGDGPADRQPPSDAPDAPAAVCVPNLLADPSFEAGSPNPAWGESSTNFGSPICSSLAACGTSSFIAPRTGQAWAWFGGTASPETASLTQTVTFPAGTATLQFHLWVGSTGSSNNVFSVQVDSTTVFTATGAQASSYVTYTLVSRDVSAFADGAPHTVSFNVSTTGQIENFNLDDVGLCSGAPTDQFLPLVYKPPAASADLSVSRVEVIQGTTMSDAYTVHIAGRPALLRAFLGLASTSGASSQTGVSGRLTRYVGGVALDSVTAGPITVQAATSEGDLAQTLNFNLPASWLAAGTSYVLEVDHDNLVPETNETNNHYPAAGQQSFGFAAADPLTVVVVPVSYKGTLPNTSDLSYLTWMPLKVFPVSQITYTLWPGGVHTFNGDLSPLDGSGWVALLNEITALQGTDTGKIYYGLVNSYGADGCSGGCIAGIGWIGFPASAGFSGFSAGDAEASPTFTHEMGHNFERYHAPCGTTSGTDPDYPYGPLATIGQWGYDTATGLLYHPAGLGFYRDYMSYCGPEWTSDYTYRAIYDFRAANPYAPRAGVQLESALFLSGWIGADGEVHLHSVYRQEAALEAPAAGTHRAELLDESGRVLAAQPFSLVSIAADTQTSGLYLQGFRLNLPYAENAAAIRIYAGEELLFERRAAGPAPRLAAGGAPVRSGAGAAVRWVLESGAEGVTYRVRFSGDGGKNWQVLRLNQKEPAILVPESLLAGAPQPLVEVQAVDGVRVSRLLIPLEADRTSGVFQFGE